jgi:hypothetical protein
MKFNESVGGLAFEGACDLVVMYCNPEMADFNNPRGEIYGYRPFVFATDIMGNRKTMYTGPATRDDGAALKGAEYVAKCLQARWDNYGKLPIRFCDWQDTRPAYGSEAYIAYGAADDLAWERAQEDY